MKYIIFLTFILLTQIYSQSCSANTLNIVGNGKTSVNPDIAVFSISASQTASTSKDAQNKINTIINQLFGIFAVQKIPTTNFSTTAISFSPQYKYVDLKQVYVGQKASQTIKLTYGQISNVAALITAISVANVNIDQLYFSVSNPSAAKKQARIAAVKDANTKLTQLLSLSGLKKGSVKQVTDFNTDNVLPWRANAATYATVSRFSNTYGLVDVTASVNVIWGTL